MKYNFIIFFKWILCILAFIIACNIIYHLSIEEAPGQKILVDLPRNYKYISIQDMFHEMHKCAEVTNEQVMGNTLTNDDTVFLIAYEENNGTMIFYYSWPEIVSNTARCYYGRKVFVPIIEEATQSFNAWTVVFDTQIGVIMFKQDVFAIRVFATMAIFIIFVVLVTKRK